jgi:3-oxocholest-4-en-26-oyl-CoA dehydrogenase alpha subunit
MNFDPDQTHGEFLAEMADLFASIDTSRVEGFAEESDTRALSDDDIDFLHELGRRGWLGVGFPTEYGGQGRTSAEQLLFMEELAYRRLPHPGLGVMFVGPTLLRAGTPDQIAAYIPGILSGDIRFSVGYTEPEAGSDLAALRTRARRSGSTYVVDGQKTFNSGTRHATHLWFAARTDPDAERHRGISIFVMPIDTPGVTVSPIRTQTELLLHDIFFDNVELPPEALIGDENHGWQIIMSAMDRERLEPVSGMGRLIDEISAWASTPGPDGTAPSESPRVRESLGRLYAAIDCARLFARRLAWMIDHDLHPVAETSMAKIINTELRQLVPSVGLDLMGVDGQLALGEHGAPAGGRVERAYRGSTWMKIAGGANEVHRDLIARKALGLPRPD